jgi:hypothetical protein
VRFFFVKEIESSWSEYWKQTQPPDHPILKGILAKRANLAEEAGVEYLQPTKYVRMIREFASEFGQHPDDVFNRTEAATVFVFSVDACRSGYYSDIYNTIEQLNQAPPGEAQL